MRISDIPNLLLDATLSIVYPQPCAVCGASVESRVDGVACAACWKETRIFNGDETICWKCGVEARGNVPYDKRREVLCRRCDEYSFTAARACGIYQSALRASVLSLKREPYIATKLTDLMIATQQREPLDSATRIVPVPLHPKRQRERGFNQATELGRALALKTGLALDEGSLVRKIHTERHRAGMDAQTRRESVEDAFEVKRPRLVSGESILLIDDVFTTGATVSACASALKAAGASEVFVLTVARSASA
jgi:ComF family protein